MNSVLRIALELGIILLTYACGSQNASLSGAARNVKGTSSGSAESKPSPIEHSSSEPQNQTEIGNAIPSTVQATPQPISKPRDSENIDPCAHAQNDSVFILDLKSGWFAGDGGLYYKSVVDNGCNGTVKVTYLHLDSSGLISSNVNYKDLISCDSSNWTPGWPDFGDDNGACVLSININKYSEFWLLGGDENDAADIRLSSPFWASVKEKTRNLRDANPKAGFFFGAGSGNIQHSNELAKHLFPEIAGNSLKPEEGLFAYNPKNQRGGLGGLWAGTVTPAVSKFLVSGNGINPGTFDNTTFPFGAFGILPALNSVFDFSFCPTDPVVPLGTHATKKVVATDYSGNTSVVQFQVGGHKILAEGDMPRFYGLPEYFNRVILSLLP